MTDSILIFTFSPVQSFISEARRTADLFTGSQILVELAKKAAEAIGTKRLIYPALDEKGELPSDIPNKLVAKVPFEECETIADEARKAILKRWREIAGEAREAFLKESGLPFDEAIWQRQISDNYLWETYWSAALLPDDNHYKESYTEAEAGLISAKFTRPFSQPFFTNSKGEVEFGEPGFKDTLSGKRQALRSQDEDGRKYWYNVGQVETITPIKIRPSVKETERPRERLDAAGVIKRFHPQISEKSVKPFHGFPSTSSIASLDYLETIRKDIKDYRSVLTKLFGKKSRLMRVREVDKNTAEEHISDDKFPYDGDFLYMETFTPKRLQNDYGLNPKDIEAYLPGKDGAKANLKELQDKHGHPSPYYAIIVLDGDDMGKHLRTLDEHGHREFSKSLRKFSKSAPEIVAERGRVVYNGGDDVLAFAPLSTALVLAADLAHEFNKATGRAASAGIAITHHLSPLGTALEAARRAEHTAKSMQDKNAVCILALKRSGDPIEVISKWDALKKGEIETGLFSEFVVEFQSDDLSSKLPYDLFRSAYAIPKIGDFPQANNMFKAELYRLIKRHLQKGKSTEKEEKAKDFTEGLFKWAGSLTETREMNIPQHLAQWLALARFIAKGGDA
jgi:CRISPR-associated protein Cmr2